jgi:hypothetical protein
MLLPVCLAPFGDQAVVVFIESDGPGGAVYRPVANEKALTFEVRGGVFIDRETGSAWNLAGRAADGPLACAQLPATPSKTGFWFAIIAADPEITVYQGGS